MDLKNKLKKLFLRYEELEKMMADHETIKNQKRLQELAKEYAQLKEPVKLYHAFNLALREESEYKEIIVHGEDEDLVAIALHERPECQKKIESLEKKIRAYLVPRDSNDEKDVIMEIRAGTGGDEAALFAGVLFRMYSRYAENCRWKIEILNSSPTGLGGFKEIIFSVQGESVFQKLKYERGGHRVQRIPVTESGGRIHTSAATVAVLPEADEIEFVLDPSDLRIDVYRASGAGGQHVNKTESAVRITHLPTNTMVQCQDGKSQYQNKAQALKVLRARLLDHFEQEQQRKISQDRKNQIGSGDRNERIRTYNFPQGRLTDHRINLTLYSLDELLEGNLDPLIDALCEAAFFESLHD